MNEHWRVDGYISSHYSDINDRSGDQIAAIGYVASAVGTDDLPKNVQIITIIE